MTALRGWLRGFVRVRVRGGSPGVFLTRLMEAGHAAWSVRTEADGSLTCSMEARTFLKCRGWARRARCTVRVLRRGGFPFLVRAVLRRPGGWAGAIVCLCALVCLSQVVWRVEVIGAELTPEAEIREVLVELGVRPGVLRHHIDVPAVELELLRRIPRLSWVNVGLRGTWVVVQVAERAVLPPESPGSPVALVASRSGTVTAVVVLDGRARVQEGDTVREGQVLIEPPGEGPCAAARGAVWARVWYQEYVEVPKAVPQSVLTGRHWTRRVIRIGRWTVELGLPKREPPFLSYRILERRQPIIGWRNASCLVEAITYIYCETREQINTVDDAQEAAELAERLAWARIRPLPGATREETEVRVELIHETPDVYGFRVVVESVEMIARPQPYSKKR